MEEMHICPECGLAWWSTNTDGLWNCSDCGTLIQPFKESAHEEPGHNIMAALGDQESNR